MKYESSVVVHITTFAPEQYLLHRDIPVLLCQVGERFHCTFLDANVRASGHTDIDAFNGLKKLLLNMVEDLGARGAHHLTETEVQQKAVLAQFIERYEDRFEL